MPERMTIGAAQDIDFDTRANRSTYVKRRIRERREQVPCVAPSRELGAGRVRWRSGEAGANTAW